MFVRMQHQIAKNLVFFGIQQAVNGLGTLYYYILILYHFMFPFRCPSENRPNEHFLFHRSGGALKADRQEGHCARPRTVTEVAKARSQQLVQYLMAPQGWTGGY